MAPQHTSSALRSPGDIYIAGYKKADDWRAFSATPTVGGDAAQWRDAFENYFHTRLSLRYLEPIRVLQESGTYQGEGFSILAIQCTLIEFLESTLQGKSYRYKRPADPPLGPYEYSDSGKIFVRFLTTRKPFANDFDIPLAWDFYKNVRCGLLHEARTKGDWTIWAKGSAGRIASAADKIVYRDNFHSGLLEFVEWYKGTLPSDASLQQAFIRKFDSLCQ